MVSTVQSSVKRPTTVRSSIDTGGDSTFLYSIIMSNFLSAWSPFSFFTVFFLTSLTEVSNIYLAGDRKSPVFYRVYLSIAVLAIN